ncbi:MAG: aminotransferase class I/II-fold pyridoxal phosphate-dependent enzyme [Bacteroidota bacterium]
MSRIYLSAPHMGVKEQANIAEAFATNWIAPLGPFVDGFEKKLCEFTGSGHAAALSSGTAALHLGLMLCGVKTGDIVLCPSFTFSATVNPVIYIGAEPVFIDSEKETWNMSPDLLRIAIKVLKTEGKTPKALLIVHLYGMPAAMDELLQIAKENNLAVIEDAAESLGSLYKGKHTGTFGKTGILSFNGNKIITTSGGGALLSDDEELIKKSRFLATQARDQAPHYQHSEIGYNYRLSNICAAIGCGQMEVLNDRIAQRRNNFDKYHTAFKNTDAISLLQEPEGYFSNRWLSTIIIDPEKTKGNTTREDVRLKLDTLNIESRPLWKPMHMQPVFEKHRAFTDGTCEQLFKNGLCLPSGSSLTDEQHALICKTILEVVK